MNNLEKKFYRYLVDRPFLFIDPQMNRKIAKALAKIAVRELDSTKLIETNANNVREVIAEGKMVKNILYFPRGGTSEGVMFSGAIFNKYDGKKIRLIIESEKK
ncbi:MAG: hypothetical protein ACTSPI_00910 [Candidatus Heimdallarchaeaceae archaeon]